MTTPAPQRKKLIEVALPLDEINIACRADKERKSGTVRNLHKWFAPMPLPAWRALLFASLIDDPGDDEKRSYLLDVIKRLVANGADLPDASTVQEAQAIIARQFPETLPTVYDPFCGGGSTLIEGQRLGLPTYGTDLNPVPALITRTLTQLLPKVEGRQPLHPENVGAKPRTKKSRMSGVQDVAIALFAPATAPRAYVGLDGLRRDVTVYGDWVKARAWDRLRNVYAMPADESVLVWLWARTVRCRNPACAVETVLATSWWLSRKSGDRAWLQPRVSDGAVVLDVLTGQRTGDAPPSAKAGRGASFICVGCAAVLDEGYIAEEGLGGRLGLRMTAVVSEKDGRRIYRKPTLEEIEAAEKVCRPDDFPRIPLPNIPRWFSGPRFGLKEQADLYTPRQLHTLMTFACAVREVHGKVLEDGGDQAWADAVATILGLAVGKMAQYGSSQAMITTFADSSTRFNSGFGRNDLPMTWDFFEMNFFGSGGGDWDRLVQTCAAATKFSGGGKGEVARCDARVSQSPAPALIATDPPYFDAIGYADLSDYFYVWHRLALRDVHPDLYQTLAAPRSGELTAVPAHHGNSKDAARTYFIQGFTETFRNLKTSAAPGLPMLVVYASKEQKGGREEETRWSSILTAMVQSELEIVGTWPVHGTGSTRMIGQGTNAVASYVVMVCRSRQETAGTCSLTDLNRALRRELRPAVQAFQAAGILPVDLAQAAMGPGMQVYSRYRKVVDQSGEAVSVERALRLINAALGEVLDEQEGELDSYSRFAVAWWEKHGWGAAAFGEADQLARPHGVSVDDLIRAGVAHSPMPGSIQVLGNDTLDPLWTPTLDNRPTAWEAVHHLAWRLIDGGGAAEGARLMSDLGTLRDPAQALVYRLHDIAARKNRTKDQERYNALIGSWSDLLSLAVTENEGLF